MFGTHWYDGIPIGAVAALLLLGLRELVDWIRGQWARYRLLVAINRAQRVLDLARAITRERNVSRETEHVSCFGPDGKCEER